MLKFKRKFRRQRVNSKVSDWYSRINSTESAASGATNLSDTRLMSQGRRARSRMRVDQRDSLIRTADVLVFVCLPSSCSHVTEVRGPKGL